MKNYENIKRLAYVLGIHEEALNTVGALRDILYSEIANRTDMDLIEITRQANEHNTLYKRIAVEVLDNKESPEDLVGIANLIREDFVQIEVLTELLNVVSNETDHEIYELIKLYQESYE